MINVLELLVKFLKNYHPHGDGSVYDTLVRMAQPWVMRYPLLTVKGILVRLMVTLLLLIDIRNVVLLKFRKNC